MMQNELRTIINTPSNILNSTNYAIYLKNEIKKYKNINIKIYNEKDLKKLGCNLILGVNQGSKNEAKMIIINYKNIDNNIKNNKPVLLIGKGVMFDSGGYNLKTGDFSDMKYDMTGTAIIYGILLLLSKFNIKGHFIGILPLVENMIGSNAIKPGDILTAYNGSTIEITNTDCEGRLILADAISYSSKYKPKLIIDIATLTGQSATIFGSNTSVIMGNNNKYIQEIIKYGNENNEKIWELPMWEEYMEYTKSKIADYKNLSYDIKASTIMAGAFLYNFVPKKTDWIHLDIGGTSDIKENTNMRHYGASGELMRSLLDFLINN
jgi:leucyl aminopeptidase